MGDTGCHCVQVQRPGWEEYGGSDLKEGWTRTVMQ